MKLSVILPCFNGAQTIAVQLEALANQEWSEPWEVIVSNNGSTDDSMAIVERYRERLPNLRIVYAYTPPGPRRGVAHSYKVGIKAATGDAFVFCEADDEVAPGWLAAMGEALKKHDFVAGAIDNAKLNEPWLIASGPHIQATGLVKNPHPPYKLYAFGCNVGMKRSLYEAVGEFDESCLTGWDMDYCSRVQLAGTEIHFEPKALVHYRQRHKFPDLYRQGRSWGANTMILLKKYSEPMTSFKLLKHLVREFLGSLQHLLSIFQVHSKAGFAGWVWGCGWHLGILQGSVKYLLRNDSGVKPVLAHVEAAKKQISV